MGNNTSANCLFCKIVSGQEQSVNYYEDEEIVIFKDIKPVSKYHLLAIPKIHIDSINVLNSSHIALVEKLIGQGEATLKELGADTNDILFGFHCPPFNSISHVHLHCISPSTDMSFLHKVMFQPNTKWFKTGQQVLNLLRNKL